MPTFSKSERSAIRTLRNLSNERSKLNASHALVILFENSEKSAVFCENVIDEHRFGCDVEIVRYYDTAILKTANKEDANQVKADLDSMTDAAKCYFHGNLDLTECEAASGFNPDWLTKQAPSFGILTYGTYKGSDSEWLYDQIIEKYEEMFRADKERTEALQAASKFMLSDWIRENHAFLVGNFHGADADASSRFMCELVKACYDGLTLPYFHFISIQNATVAKFNTFAYSIIHGMEPGRGRLQYDYEWQLDAQRFALGVRMGAHEKLSPVEFLSKKVMDALPDLRFISKVGHVNPNTDQSMFTNHFDSAFNVSSAFSKIRGTWIRVNGMDKNYVDRILTPESVDSLNELKAERKMRALTEYMVNDLLNCFCAAYAAKMVSDLNDLSGSYEKMHEALKGQFWETELSAAFEHTRENWFNVDFDLI